jgi:hypothetical protein
MSADEIEATDAAKTRFQQIAETVAGPRLVQLPLWPEDRRGAPNAVLRSAVFSAGKPTAERAHRKKELLPVLPPYAIYYSGPQLYQPDLDVWLELLHRCRLTSLGLSAAVTVRSLLRGLGRATGKANYEYTRESARALTTATLEVVVRDDRPGRRGQRGYVGHLVDAFAYDDVREVWEVDLNPRIAALFAADEHTWLASSARRELGKGYLAKWLHGYFSTHREPLPISVERLRDLSGTSTKQLRDFRGALRRALVEVARVERDEGRRFEWRVDAESDLVEVIRG